MATCAKLGSIGVAADPAGAAVDDGIGNGNGEGVVGAAVGGAAGVGVGCGAVGYGAPCVGGG